WEQVYTRIKEYRSKNSAPVDTMGCERLADDTADPKVYRFQTLVSLMLSSMTKDATTAGAVRNLQKVGLTIENMIDTSVEDIDECIRKVGFHSKKAICIKKVAEICRDEYDGDIPSTLEGLVKLPGVGPKMAHLTLQVAWKKNVGIGVDVHVDRISHRLKWVDSEAKTPEHTRKQLESWLPSEYWTEINPLFVGFGQILCKGSGPRCGECPVRDLCPSATVK
ncbi:DNA glycosylase, partial [Dimargaris cristalligena]